jgi:rubrerythrin
MDYTKLLILAMKKEDKSVKLYTTLAAASTQPQLKDIFLKLAREEAQHKLRFELEYDLTTF